MDSEQKKDYIPINYLITTDYKWILNESKQLITESGFGLAVTLHRQLVDKVIS
jgi:hypothetical protein